MKIDRRIDRLWGGGGLEILIPVLSCVVRPSA
jgi:hypothetical protein